MLEVVAQELSAAVRSAIAAVKASLQHAAVRRTLAAVVIADIVILAAYVRWADAEHFRLEHSYFYNKPFFSSADWSLMEVAGYLKEFTCVLMLGLISWRTRSSLFAALTVFVIVILGDDSLQFHENIGAALAARGVYKPISQAIAAGIEAVVPVTLLVIGWTRSDRAQRRDAGAVLVSIAILLFFAVGVDTIHELVKQITVKHGKIFALFEDGGELLSLTVMLAVVSGLFVRVSALAFRNPGILSAR